MGYYEFLKDILRPLRLYELDDGFGSLELQIAGDALDDIFDFLSYAESEASVLTAETFGIQGFEEIFPKYELADALDVRRESIFSLMRIDGHSHTIQAIRNAVSCFGINAELDELPGEDTVIIRFPGIHGAPRGFARIKWLLEMIIPCHLEIFYDLIRSTWADIESKFVTWNYIESRKMDWEAFEGI